MVGAFKPHAASLGLTSKTTWLWILSFSTKCFWLEMVDYQEIKRKFGGCLQTWGGFHCPRAEETDLRMLLGPRVLLSPGGDLNGMKRWKRPVCEERATAGSILRGKPANTLLRKCPLDGSCTFQNILQVLGYSAFSWLSVYVNPFLFFFCFSLIVRCCHAEALVLIGWLKYISGDRFSCFPQNGSHGFAELLGYSAGLLHSYNYQKPESLLG